MWTSSAARGYDFWARYLDVFTDVRILARARKCDAPSPSWIEATGDGVAPAALPYYKGLRGFTASLPTLGRAIALSLDDRAAVLLRLPCPIGDLTRRLMPAGRPYAVEVVGDPVEAFGPGGVNHVLRPVLRRQMTRSLRKACSAACAVGYVSEHSLQRRYPSGPIAFRTACSDVELDDAAFVLPPVATVGPRADVTIVTVGSLEQPYKGTDLLIDAVAACVESGLNVRLRVVGDGQYRPALERQTAKRDIESRVTFVGQLSSADAIRAELDGADLFVLPSRAEGLPKALLEAMARARPCIGSAIGGIPELLPREDLVAPGNVSALADKISEVATDPCRMTQMSIRNLDRAAAFHRRFLRPKRAELYRHLDYCTRAWQAANGTEAERLCGADTGVC